MTTRVLTLFGTRPEIIKLAPVIQGLEEYAGLVETINVASAQHTDLLYPFARAFGVRIDHDLQVMQPNQSPSEVCARVMAALDPIVREKRPDIVLVQGDTTTTLAGAVVGFYNAVPVAHVEAGLRSGNPAIPFPEEMNRRLVSRCASYHFAATEHNRHTLLREGVSEETIFVTGNPVVDSLMKILRAHSPGAVVAELLRQTKGSRRIVLTTHRRESLGRRMAENLHVLRHFVEQNEDVTLLFPVHPNPMVVESAQSVLAGHSRIHLTPPLGYEDFVLLLANSWLIVSDSGGVQEEAPTLGKPVLILRENTERPEAVQCGVARLVGGEPGRLEEMLDHLNRDRTWMATVQKIANPFGRGDSGRRIASIVVDLIAQRNGMSISESTNRV